MAMDSPLLYSTKISGAKHLLVNFKYGNKEPRLSETAEVKRYLQAQAGNGAHLKMGITQDSDLGEEISITVIATGFAAPETSYSHINTHIDEVIVDENEPAVGVEPALLSADDSDDGFVDQAPRNEGLRTNHREEAIQRYSVDLNIPAFMRRNITVELPPLSTDDKVSRIVIGEQEEETRDTSIKPNKYLHDNVD